MVLILLNVLVIFNLIEIQNTICKHILIAKHNPTRIMYDKKRTFCLSVSVYRVYFLRNRK